MSLKDPSDSSFFASTFFSSAGEAEVEGQDLLLFLLLGAGLAAGAGPAAPTLQMRLPMLTWASVFADKLGPVRFNIYTSCFSEGTDLILRQHHVAPHRHHIVL